MIETPGSGNPDQPAPTDADIDALFKPVGHDGPHHDMRLAGSVDPVADDFARSPIGPVFSWHDRPRRLVFTWTGDPKADVQIADLDGVGIATFPLSVAIVDAMFAGADASGMLELFQLACAGQGEPETPEQTTAINALLTAVGEISSDDAGRSVPALIAVHEAACDLLVALRG